MPTVPNADKSASQLKGFLETIPNLKNGMMERNVKRIIDFAMKLEGWRATLRSMPPPSSYQRTRSPNTPLSSVPRRMERDHQPV
jgi:hypothetical protein